MKKYLIVFVSVVLLGSGVWANMLGNPGFETTNDWTIYDNSGRSDWADRSEDYGIGLYGWGAGDGGCYQTIATTTTGAYTFAIWIREEEHFDPTTLDMKLEWYDSSFSYVQSPTVASWIDIPQDTYWHQIYVSGVVSDTNIAYIRPVLFMDWGSYTSVNAAAMCDDATLYQGAFTGTSARLSNGSFELRSTNDNWRGSQWAAVPEDFNVGRATWAYRSGDWGVAYAGWDAGSNFTAHVVQAAYPGTGTYSFVANLSRETNFIGTNVELRIEWYDRTCSNQVQASTVTNVVVPSDNVFRPYWVTGACSDTNLYEVRCVVYQAWDGNTNNVPSKAARLDDARLLPGAYDGHSIDSHYAYYSEPGYDASVEQVPGTNVGAFLQVDYTTGTNTTYVLADTNFALYAQETGEVNFRSSYQRPDTFDWVNTNLAMTKVGTVSLSSASPFHGQPAAGTLDLDLWRCEWAQPTATNGLLYTNSITVYLSPYISTYNGANETERKYLVLQNATETNLLRQLLSDDYIGNDYSYVNSPAPVPTSLVSPGFETPDTNSLENSGWSSWGNAAKEDWAARVGAYGAYFPSWDAGNAGIYQDVAAAANTYTYSLWVQFMEGVQCTYADLKLEWYTTAGGLLQTDTKVVTTLPADEQWHKLYITGTCSSSGVYRVRPVFTASYSTGALPFHEAIRMDDAQLYTGSFTSEQWLANGGFEDKGTNGFNGAYWTGLPDSLVSIENWATAAHSGSWGGAFKGWESNATAAAISQSLVVPPGAYTVTAWLRREVAMDLTNMDIVISWYDGTFTNKVQADSISSLTVSNDDTWRQYTFPVTCTNSDLYETRLAFVGQWREASGATTLDDVTFTAGGGYTDGIPNWWWAQYGLALTNTAAGDNDSDTWNNKDEYVCDTDPTNAASFYYNYITNNPEAGDTIDLIAGPPTTNSRIYDAWWTTDLVDGAWTAFGFDQTGQADGSAVVFTVTNAPDVRFYRTGVKVP